MLIVNERYDELKRRMSRATTERARHKAAWEQITLSAVVCEYPDLLPRYLRKLARSCFVETREELYRARKIELTRMLRAVERELARELANRGHR